MSWRSSKKDTVVDSTIEAKYIAASDGTKEAVWIKILFLDWVLFLALQTQWTSIVTIMGAIAQAKEPRSHQRSKHKLKRFHLIREIIERGHGKICRVHTDDNVANPLTKPLPQSKHDSHTIGIRFMPDWA